LDDNRFWPFDVLPPDRRTPLHQQEIDFLKAAYRVGFRPYQFGSENVGASAGERWAYIFRRTRRFWELRVGAPTEGILFAYVAGFEVNAEAVLLWLRGEDLAGVLEFIRPCLVPAGGYRVEPAIAT
jgi:hypothetical protein